MKVLCIGHAAYDMTALLDEFPKENTKNRVNERVECTGGPATTAASLLGKWNVDTHLMTLVGNDYYGKKILNELKEFNVNTKYIEINNDYSTTNSFIIANKQNGSRTIFTFKNNKINMKDNDIDFIPDIILVDGQEYELSLKMINKYKNAISVIDAGRSCKEVVDLSSRVDYLICSKKYAEDETKILFNDNNMEEIYHKLEEKYHNNIIVTLESKGCLYKKDNLVKLMPSVMVKASDSTGAGDIFHGAFVYALTKGYSLEKALRLSNIAGAISVTRVGGRFSIPELEEVESIYNETR